MAATKETDKVAQHLAYANRYGLCPVCRKRPRALWKDGSGLRITCGDHICFLRWLPGGHSAPEKMVDAVLPHEETVEA